MTPQSHSTMWRHNSNTKNVTASASEWDRAHFESCGSGLVLECIILYNALCTMHAGETMHCKPCYNVKQAGIPYWRRCLPGWDVEHSMPMASLNISKATQMNKWRKVWKKNKLFEIKDRTEDRSQSIPKSIGTLTMLRCIFGPNLEVLTLISDDLSRGQTHRLKMG